MSYKIPRILSSYKWSVLGLSINKMLKIINGNRRNKGFKLAVWNCGRGIITDDGPDKLADIQEFIDSKRPHCLGIIESDLFGMNSDLNRKKYTKLEIEEKLGIDGYRIELPSSWEAYGQARIICYVSNDIKCQRIRLNDGKDHIPSITLAVGQGKATKTLVHYYYREWKNGVTGESDMNSQVAYLQQHLSQLEHLVRQDHQVVALGDANVCALHWNDLNYRHKTLENEIQEFLLRESCFQLVDKYTRIQSVSGSLQYSCLDHVTTNVPEKCNIPEVFSSLSSDHLPVMVTKLSHEVRTQPKTIRKRLYKNFSPYAFLLEVNSCLENGLFDQVLSNNDIEEASAIFSGLFGSILNRHAPLKTIQVRANYVPWISSETKQLQAVRDTIKKEAIMENDNEKFETYKKLGNFIGKRLKAQLLQNKILSRKAIYLCSLETSK